MGETKHGKVLELIQVTILFSYLVNVVNHEWQRMLSVELRVKNSARYFF